MTDSLCACSILLSMPRQSCPNGSTDRLRSYLDQRRMCVTADTNQVSYHSSNSRRSMHFPGWRAVSRAFAPAPDLEATHIQEQYLNSLNVHREGSAKHISLTSTRGSQCSGGETHLPPTLGGNEEACVGGGRGEALGPTTRQRQAVCEGAARRFAG